MEELDLYLEYNKAYDKYITKLMRLSSKNLIESAKQEFEKKANDYISKFGDNTFYTDKIRNDIALLNDKF